MESLAAYPWQMWVTLAAIAVVVGLYASEKVSMELISGGTVAAFLAFFQLFPIEGPEGDNLLRPAVLLSGFASTALISVLALLIIGQGIFQTGALEEPTRRLVEWQKKRPVMTIAVTALLIMGISAALNNTPVVVMFIPIVAALAQRSGTAASKVMIPLSYLSILAGQLTLIGSSTNLLIAEQFRSLDVGEFGFFAMTDMGLVLAGVGAAYVIFLLPRFLPERYGEAEAAGPSGKHFVAQIDLHEGHPLVGAKAKSGMFPKLERTTVRLVQRGERAFLPPFENVTLKAGDTVVIAATRSRLVELIQSDPPLLGGMVSGVEDGIERREGLKELATTEAVVAPGSRMIGRTVGQIGFRYQTRCILLGIQRRSRMIRKRMGEIRLEAGDVLLLLGTRQDIRNLRNNRDVLLLDWSTVELTDHSMARRAGLIFLGVIAMAASGLLPIVVASFLGAVAMVASGCLNLRQALRAVDERIYFLVGSALAMGTALEATSGAAFLGGLITSGFMGFGPAVTLSALFLAVAIMTNLLSNNATAVLFTPIAINVAQRFDTDPLPFALAVLFAANCSFASPIGYKTNLLVMGPGHYRFADFTRAGAPLVLILWAVFSVLAPWWYSL